MRNTVLPSLLLLVGIAGCHDHGVPPGGGGDMSVGDMSIPSDMSIADMPPPEDIRQFVTFTMFSADLAQALCTHYMTCGILDQSQFNACIERNTRGTGWDQDIEIMKGRLLINELQCLDAVKAARCDGSDTQSWVTHCQQFLYQPNQALGAACVASEECVSGYCQHGGSDGGTPYEQPTGCPGQCATPKAPGSTCRIDSECTSDSICDNGPGGTNTCIKQGMLNDACQNYLFTGSATAPFCLFGLYCPTFSNTPTCAVPTMQSTLHGACDPMLGQQSSTPPCTSANYCRLAYTMSATACGPSMACPYGSYCDATSMKCMTPTSATCETKIASGMPCDPNNVGFASYAESQCADGTACLQLPGQTGFTCQARSAAAGGCNVDGDCKLGLFCNNHVCASWISDTQVCTAGTQCASGKCIADNADAGTTLTCQPNKSFGATCMPTFEDSLCWQSDIESSTLCQPTTMGSGVCAPKCY